MNSNRDKTKNREHFVLYREKTGYQRAVGEGGDERGDGDQHTYEH